jgi:hypothetical protein
MYRRFPENRRQWMGNVFIQHLIFFIVPHRFNTFGSMNHKFNDSITIKLLVGTHVIHKNYFFHTTTPISNPTAWAQCVRMQPKIQSWTQHIESWLSNRGTVQTAPDRYCWSPN